MHVFQQTARTPDASYVSLRSTELPLSSLVMARVESPRQEVFLQLVLQSTQHLRMLREFS